jgi:predicted alpha/beta hydrolase family esterase
MPVPTLVIASSNDAYGTRSTSKDLPIIVAGPLGHINSASDLGRWDQGRNLLEAFTAGFKTR